MNATQKLAAGFALVFTLMPLGADAATENGLFAARGIGARPCASLATTETGGLTDAARAELGSWIAGYLSHANRSIGARYETVPVQNTNALAELTRSVCANNPDNLVETVFFAVLERFDALAQGGETPLLTLRNDRYQVGVRAATVTEVQSYLASAGYLEAAAADGIYGPKTAAALANWQRDREITQTGLPDAMTLFLIAADLAQ